MREAYEREFDLVIGVNILPNEFHFAFRLAGKYDAQFIQLDYVAGKYDKGELNFSAYSRMKENFPDIVVLGGVWPKYYTPVKYSDLETDVITGMERAEAIVVTGDGTGLETPYDKIERFREIMGDHPLVIGAGLTPQNAYRQLCIADGAIVGTCFKVGDQTNNIVDRLKVRDFMSVVKEARLYQENVSRFRE